MWPGVGLVGCAGGSGGSVCGSKGCSAVHAVCSGGGRAGYGVGGVVVAARGVGCGVM